jgi:hypothetical protein
VIEYAIEKASYRKLPGLHRPVSERSSVIRGCEKVACISMLVSLSNDTNYRKSLQQTPGLRRLIVSGYTSSPRITLR